jgi:hypothetical protein
MRVYVLTTNIIYPGQLIAFAFVYTSLILMFVYGFLVQHMNYSHDSFGLNCLQSLCTLSAGPKNIGASQRVNMSSFDCYMYSVGALFNTKLCRNNVKLCEIVKTQSEIV